MRPPAFPMAMIATATKARAPMLFLAMPLMLLIFGTVLGGMCLIGGLVFAALQYSGKS